MTTAGPVLTLSRLQVFDIELATGSFIQQRQQRNKKQMDMTILNILVVDQQRVFRSGLKHLIENDLGGCRVTEAARLDDVEHGRPFDLLLIDVAAVDLEVLAAMRHRRAILSQSKERADVLRCLAEGFHGYIHKTSPDMEIAQAVADLLAGRIYAPRWLADGSAIPDQPPIKLSKRQAQILPMLAQGMSSKEIARKLGISEGTTKIHTSALLRAIGAKNRTEAAFVAAQIIKTHRS